MCSFSKNKGGMPMSLQYSYALYEKDFSHEFREKLNRSEDGSDISNHFSHTITKMFNKIFGDKFKTIEKERKMSCSRKNGSR